MVGHGLDRGGPKDSETAPSSFLTKINGKGFWRFATDLCLAFHLTQGSTVECEEIEEYDQSFP